VLAGRKATANTPNPGFEKAMMNVLHLLAFQLQKLYN
jgi:hypothetical protein